VVGGGPVDGLEQTLRAVGAQTRRPRQLIVAASPAAGRAKHDAAGIPVRALGGRGGGAPDVARALVEAVAEPDDWLWLLRAGTVPAPEALEHLLKPLTLAQLDPAPVLLAGRVNDPHGRLDPASAPVLRNVDQQAVIRGARHRLLALRSARYGSLLLLRTAVEESGPPRLRGLGDEGDAEWTARLLKSQVGYLVPSSLAVRAGIGGTGAEGSSAGRLAVRNRVAMIGGEAWTRDERLWLGVGLVTDLVARIRSPAR
jgi:hypothetical protein